MVLYYLCQLWQGGSMNPILINNSKIPVYLSWFSPLNEIWAVTIFPFIFCRGELDEADLRHESIHFQQYLDTFVLGFLLIYGWDYLKGRIKYRNDISGISAHNGPYQDAGDKAYYRTRAEQEAYSNDSDISYLENRKRYQWLVKYKV